MLEGDVAADAVTDHIEQQRPKAGALKGANVNGTGLREAVTHPDALRVTRQVAPDPARGNLELF